MTVVALSHGYPPYWNMGGEVSLHRTLRVLDDAVVLTSTPEPYTFEGVRVQSLEGVPNVLDTHSDPAPIARALHRLGATVVIGQNELSLPAVKAAKLVGAVSIVSVHTPPRYGAGIREGLLQADHAIYNTAVSAREWGEPQALVVHPPLGPLPAHPLAWWPDGPPTGSAYTLLSALRNKGVETVLALAERMPTQEFLLVRSPAEPTHGLPDILERVAALPNVELAPRVAPDEVAEAYFSRTRILLVPSRYETYGMSALEAAGYGIPTVHVDTPHVREGIGEAACLVPPLDVDNTNRAINVIEDRYATWSARSRERAEEITVRQELELAAFKAFIANVTVRSGQHRTARQRAIQYAIRGRLRPTPTARPLGWR